MTETSLKSWHEVAPHLIAVAAGREAADLVIRGARAVNVHTREVLENWDVAVAQGRIAYVGPDASHCLGREVIDAEGRYLIPGLCDAHMHIESGMLTPAELADRNPSGAKLFSANPSSVNARIASSLPPAAIRSTNCCPASSRFRRSFFDTFRHIRHRARESPGGR